MLTSSSSKSAQAEAGAYEKDRCRLRDRRAKCHIIDQSAFEFSDGVDVNASDQPAAREDAKERMFGPDANVRIRNRGVKVAR